MRILARGQMPSGGRTWSRPKSVGLHYWVLPSRALYLQAKAAPFPALNGMFALRTKEIGAGVWLLDDF